MEPPYRAQRPDRLSDGNESWIRPGGAVSWHRSVIPGQRATIHGPWSSIRPRMVNVALTLLAALASVLAGAYAVFFMLTGSCVEVSFRATLELIPVFGFAVLLATSLHVAKLWELAYSRDTKDVPSSPGAAGLGGALLLHLATIAVCLIGTLFMEDRSARLAACRFQDSFFEAVTGPFLIGTMAVWYALVGAHAKAREIWARERS